MSDAQILLGDCLDAMRNLEAESVDAVVTDPPAGIGFMGKDWDRDKGGRDAWVAWLASIMREVYRVLKPGGHAIAWALPRTSHWTAWALEDAGFEVRDRLAHVFGSGFPKSLSVGKAIDAAAGAEREVVGRRQFADGTFARPGAVMGQHGTYGPAAGNPLVTAPGTPEAEKWEGWGTALKPAVEDWWLVRKPLDGTVAHNVLTHGTGALNVDGCRVGTTKDVPASAAKDRENISKGREANRTTDTGGFDPTIGRWPTNFLLSHAPGCRKVGVREVKTEMAYPGSPEWEPTEGWGRIGMNANRAPQGYASPDGTETVEAWECAEGCPVAALDGQSGERTSGLLKAGTQRAGDGGYMGHFPKTAALQDFGGDTGSASRFFPTFAPEPEAPFLYCAKAARSERDAGCDTLPRKTAGECCDRKDGSAGLSPRAGAGRTGGGRNVHPTVKPVALMRWLVRLVTPPGGVVLDPFCGSGTTLVAAVQEGFRCIGIERDEEYAAIARARVAEATRQGVLPLEGPRVTRQAEPVEKPRQFVLPLGLSK